MNIGEVSKKAALPAKTIRYYEDIGLITPLRDPNGYRCFRDLLRKNTWHRSRKRSVTFRKSGIRYRTLYANASAMNGPIVRS